MKHETVAARAWAVGSENPLLLALELPLSLPWLA